MSDSNVDPLARLIQALGRLPGIGEKTATRLSFHILRQGPDLARELATSLLEASERIHLCARCMNLTSQQVCSVCDDARRDPRLLCIVESVQDLRAIERTREFSGRYHVLHGSLSPLEGIGPDQLKIRELLERLSAEGGRGEPGPEEIILAMNPSVEGEATALYLQRVLGPMGYRVSRIASGLPMGGDLEYADPATISRALSGRHSMG